MDPEKDMFDIPTELEVPAEQAPEEVNDVASTTEEAVLATEEINPVEPTVPVEAPEIEPVLEASPEVVETPVETNEVSEVSEPPVVEEPVTPVEEPVVEPTPVEETPTEPVAEVAPEEGYVATPVVETPVAPAEVPVAPNENEFETSVMNIVNEQPAVETPVMEAPTEEAAPEVAVEQPVEVPTSTEAVQPIPFGNTPEQPEVPAAPVEAPVAPVTFENPLGQPVADLPVDNQQNLDETPPDSLSDATNKPVPEKKKINFVPIIAVLVIALVAGGIVYFVLPMLKKDKPTAEVASNLKAVKLEYKDTFEDAYNVKNINLSTLFFEDDDLYEINEGRIAVSYADSTYYISIQDIMITSFGYVMNDKGALYVFKDADNNFYIKDIEKLTEDVTLTVDDPDLYLVNKEKGVSYIAIGEYSDGRGMFLLAEKNNKKFFIDKDEEGKVVLSELADKLYDGQDIRIDSLKFNSPIEDKIKVSGIGLRYEGNVLLYSGNYDEITDFQLKDDLDNPYIADELYVAYDPDFKDATLYIFYHEEGEEYLYEVNLLTAEITEEGELKIEGKTYDSAVSKKIITDGQAYILFTNGKEINKK